MCLFFNFYVIREMVPKLGCLWGSLGKLLKNLYAQELNQMFKGGNWDFEFVKVSQLISIIIQQRLQSSDLFKDLTDKKFSVYINKVDSSQSFWDQQK